MKTNLVNELEGVRALTKDEALRAKLEGSLAESVRFIERNQMCDLGLWRSFVDVFRIRTDGEGAPYSTWRTEFWGKMMRGACMVEKYTNDDKIYLVLEKAVRELLSTQDELGRITGYSVETEFTRWDLWGRKYVLLGMQYFLEICRDEALADEIVSSMRRQADYIIAHVGEGKLDIRTCSKNWEGLNSCSILEPMIRLYRLTGERRYLEFGEYIISTGFITSANLIDLAYEDEKAPHEYPVVKAYEMMSCFEGLLQYYCLTGIEKYRTALVNFGRRIIEGELSIIGCSGCTHELFDHTAIKQTQTDYGDIVQETCVAVTWMKFAEAMLELTEDVTYADCIEQTYYNSYTGSFNTHRELTVPVCNHYVNYPQVMPFDSYSPLVSDRRGRKIGGYDILHDGSYYGCCACISAAGAGIIPQFALLRSRKGLVVNYYEKGEMRTVTPDGGAVALRLETEYPYDGRVRIELSLDNAESFELRLRVPSWCESATLSVEGRDQTVNSGYVSLERLWRDGDVILLDMPMDVKRTLPPKGAKNEDVFAAYTRGPVVLAADKRITDPDAVLDVSCDATGRVAYDLAACPEILDAKLCVEVGLEGGERVRLIDYASAGKTWDDTSRTAAWLYRKPL